jgi:hypothetical protein
LSNVVANQEIHTHGGVVPELARTPTKYSSVIDAALRKQTLTRTVTG